MTVSNPDLSTSYICEGNNKFRQHTIENTIDEDPRKTIFDTNFTMKFCEENMFIKGQVKIEKSLGLTINNMSNIEPAAEEIRF